MSEGDAARQTGTGSYGYRAARIAQFLIVWFAAVEPLLDATTWRNWKH